MTLLKSLVLPPTGLFLLIAVGLALRRRRRRLGTALAWSGGGLLVAATCPFVAAGLLISLQTSDPLPPRGPLPEADAIVVLGADYMPRAPELGRAAPGLLSQERLRYAAHLARRTSLPVLVTGGALIPNAPPLGRVLADSLRQDSRVQVRWIEGEARDTRENARLSARLLSAEGLRRVLLVTHAWHMPRAKAAFEAAGLEVIPAPTGFRLWPPLAVGSFLPSARSFQESTWGVHEWIGRAWYALGGG